MNISDRSSDREYIHHSYNGHKGSYFGYGMEFEPILDANYIDNVWKNNEGSKIIKSHEWSYYLDEIQKKFPDDWIIMVYRSDMSSYAWWHEAGGFQIKYPNYSKYQDSPTMMSEIMKQNSAILKFGMEHNCKWEYFTPDWVQNNFNQKVKINTIHPDILITLIK